MICPRCGSENINVQMVTDTSLKSGHGVIWWVLIGWWWVPLKWFCFFWLALIFKLFGSKNYKLQSKSHAECVCQSCGHHWIASESDTFAPAPVEAQPVKTVQPEAFFASCEVAGESHYKDGIASLGTISRDYYWPAERLYEKFVDGDRVYKYQFDRLPARLIPEPDNEHDPNAIRVEVNGVKVGYIPRTETARISPLLADGVSVLASIMGGPHKVISETSDGLLASEKEDFDFRVHLSLSRAETRANAQSAADFVKSEPKTKSYVPAWILIVLACAALLVEIVAIVSNLLPSAEALQAILPAQAVFIGMGSAIVFGILAGVFANHAE